MVSYSFKFKLTSTILSTKKLITSLGYADQINSSFFSNIHLPVRRRSSSHGTRHAGLAASELSLIHWEEPMDPKQSRFEPTGLSYLGRHAENSTRSPRHWWVESRFADHLEEAATRTHHQGGGKLHQALDCLCGCQWWSFQAPAVTRPISKFASSQHQKTTFFRATHILHCKIMFETLRTGN